MLNVKPLLVYELQHPNHGVEAVKILLDGHSCPITYSIPNIELEKTDSVLPVAH